jgi:hypothetical protein
MIRMRSSTVFGHSRFRFGAMKTGSFSSEFHLVRIQSNIRNASPSSPTDAPAVHSSKENK